MELIKRLDPLWLVLAVLGGITWLVLGVFDTNLVTEVFDDGTVVDVVYVLFGIGAVALAVRLVEGMSWVHGRHIRPTGA
jgi:uncharacterized membrane protein YuzA (DUF378 family)